MPEPAQPPTADASPLDALTARARACRLCEMHLPLGPKPIIQIGADARILIVSQAPGTRAHLSGVPWRDASGERLRGWLGVDESRFYDTANFAILPMGFCYPGRRGGGDAPPRPECAPFWHPQFLPYLAPRTTLLIGQYAQAAYLPMARKRRTLTETVRTQLKGALPAIVALPHPSPRNRIWMHREAWFEQDFVPRLREHIARQLDATGRWLK